MKGAWRTVAAAERTAGDVVVARTASGDVVRGARLIRASTSRRGRWLAENPRTGREVQVTKVFVEVDGEKP